MHAKVPAALLSGDNLDSDSGDCPSSNEPLELSRHPNWSGGSRSVSALCAVDESGEAKDHFIERDGQVFAGTHLILDMWTSHRLGDLEFMKSAMIEAVEAAGATLLHIHLHHFGPEAGVSGVAVLAESHISVHTWPERDFAAFDVFMCGDAEPHRAIEVLERAFVAERTEVIEARRGIV